jgi:signal transduction histidine kinase
MKKSSAYDFKPKNKSNLLFAAFVYLLSVLLLLSALFGFLAAYGFNAGNFLVAAIGIGLIAFAMGYLLSSDLLSPKWEMDAKFAHLSKEILHELNIPLATIDANTKMLKKGSADEKSLKRIDRIEHASLRLKRLYEELVYMINKELHTIEREQFSLAALIEERVDVFRVFGRNPFEISVADLTLWADKIGFEQMIDNLLSNAMKYSDKSTPITISTKAGVLWIQDRGVGMDEAQLVKVFERYYQADNSQQGEGIGLALVKSYCDASAIAITFESRQGFGTLVKLDLKQIIKESLS